MKIPIKTDRLSDLRYAEDLKVLDELFPHLDNDFQKLNVAFYENLITLKEYKALARVYNDQLKIRSERDESKSND